MFEWNAKHNPDHPLFVFPDGSERGTRIIKYPEAWRIIKRASKIVNGHFKRMEGTYEQKGLLQETTGPVLAILANAGTFL